MKFLEGLSIGAFVDKAKLKADLGGKRWATIEVAIGIYQDKRKAVKRTALADEILAGVPSAILASYNAMAKSDGMMAADFSLTIRSQNIELRMSPELKEPSLRAEAVDIGGFRLEMADANAHTIALYFSFTTALTDDVARFLVNNLGAHVWLAISKCQQEFPNTHAVATEAIKRADATVGRGAKA